MVGLLGCHRAESSSQAKVQPSALALPSASIPVDRLAPGELAVSSELAFGWPIPTGMAIDRVYSDAVHLSGDVSVAGLLDYLRKHARVGTAELSGSMMRFDRVRIPQQGDERRYRFDIVQQGRQVQLVIRDVTPPPTPVGVSDDERWKQAGLKPNGQPLSMTNLR